MSILSLKVISALQCLPLSFQPPKVLLLFFFGPQLSLSLFIGVQLHHMALRGKLTT